MFLSTPLGIGSFEAEEPTSPLTTHHCTRCDKPFQMDATLDSLVKEEGMQVEAVVCLTCLNQLTWAWDVSYPETIKDYS